MRGDCLWERLNEPVRYFHASRCFNDEALRKFNKNKVGGEEIVSFDIGLSELKEVAEALPPPRGRQLLAVRFLFSEQETEEIKKGVSFGYAYPSPPMSPDEKEALLKGRGFEFCGYDLIDPETVISAVTNCGADFDKGIDYAKLNEYGLFSRYAEAVRAQETLLREYPEEPHADCVVIELWRKL